MPGFGRRCPYLFLGDRVDFDRLITASILCYGPCRNRFCSFQSRLLGVAGPPLSLSCLQASAHRFGTLGLLGFWTCLATGSSLSVIGPIHWGFIVCGSRSFFCLASAGEFCAGPHVQSPPDLYCSAMARCGARLWPCLAPPRPCSEAPGVRLSLSSSCSQMRNCTLPCHAPPFHNTVYFQALCLHHHLPALLSSCPLLADRDFVLTSWTFADCPLQVLRLDLPALSVWILGVTAEGFGESGWASRLPGGFFVCRSR